MVTVISSLIEKGVQLCQISYTILYSALSVFLSILFALPKFIYELIVTLLCAAWVPSKAIAKLFKSCSGSCKTLTTSLKKVVPKNFPVLKAVWDWILTVYQDVMQSFLVSPIWIFYCGLVWIFLILLTVFIAVPAIYVEETPVELVNFSTTTIQFFEAVVNIVGVIANTLDLALNLFMYPFNAVVGFIFKAVKLIDIYSQPGNTRPRSVTIDAIVSSVQGRSLEARQLSPNIGALSPNKVIQQDDVFKTIENVIQLALTAFNLAFRAFLDYLLIILDIYLLILAPVINYLITIFREVGKYLTCCFTSPEAFGICILKVVVGRVVALLDIFLRVFFDIKKAFNDFLATLPPGNTPCTCAGFIPSVGNCPVPRYGCKELLLNGKVVFREYVQEAENDGTIETKFLSQGFDKQSACPRYNRQQGGARRALQGVEHTCEEYCFKDWNFLQCSDGYKYYKGSCSRELSSADRERHFERYVKEEDVSREEKERLLSRPPIMKIEQKLVDDPLTGEQILDILQQIEARPSKRVVCPATFDDLTFDVWLWRFTCFIDKLVADADFSKMNFDMNPLMDHVQLIGRHLDKTLPEIVQEVKKENLKYLPEGLMMKLDHLYDTINQTEKYSKVLTASLQKYVLQRPNRRMDAAPPIRATEGLVPCGNGVFRATRAECPIPSTWTMTTTAYYGMNTLMAAYETIDIERIFHDSIDCWDEVLRDRSKDPTNTENFLNLVISTATVPNSLGQLLPANDIFTVGQLKFCLPTYSSVPYFPTFVWDPARAVNEFCAPRFTQTTGGFIEVCYCPLYEASGLFDDTPWLTFLPNAARVRYYNGFMVIISFINLTFIGNIFNFVWNPFWTYWTPTDKFWINLWNYEQTQGNLDVWQVIICGLVHTPGSLLYTVTFLLYPLITLLIFFGKPTFVLVKHLLTAAIYPIFIGLWYTGSLVASINYKEIAIQNYKKFKGKVFTYYTLKKEVSPESSILIV